MFTYEEALSKAKQMGHPVRFYDDLICNICGEPWDRIGVVRCIDMTPQEKEKFVEGKGCPCCKIRKEVS